MQVTSAGNISVSDSFFEVEALMEKMKQLQEWQDEEEASQEEMASRFEIEKRESMFVFSSDDEAVTPARDVSRHFEDTSYGYKDFSKHGMYVPTFQVQDYCWEDHGYSLLITFIQMWGNGIQWQCTKMLIPQYLDVLFGTIFTACME